MQTATVRVPGNRSRSGRNSTHQCSEQADGSGLSIPPEQAGLVVGSLFRWPSYSLTPADQGTWQHQLGFRPKTPVH